MIGLNLACGSHANVTNDCVLPTSHPRYTRWISTDQVTNSEWVAQPDVLADVSDLPFAEGTFDQLYIGHFLEHIEWDELPDVGERILRTAKPNATVTVVGPALDLAEAQGEPESLLESIRERVDRHDLIARGETQKGFLHAWTATSGRTVEAAERFGLVNVTTLPVGMFAPPYWPNAAPQATWQVALTASVPE